MSSRRSTCRELAALGAACAVFAIDGAARAQACCAGTGALTPGRLAMHEEALAGLSVRGADAFGSFDASGHYVAAGGSEEDFEEDLFGAVRVLGRGQLALLAPLVETGRAAGGVSELGGGVGDVNASARYDFYYAGRSDIVPGIAALAGVTFPTGTPPDASTKPLATDATGVGAYQGNVGLALEQAYGSWLVSAYGIAAARTARTANGVHERLGTQWSFLGGATYVFPTGAAAALFVQYTFEGDATIDGAETYGSAKRATAVSLSGVLPLEDHFRLQAALSLTPPLSGLGENNTASAGLTVTGIYAFF